MICVVTRIGLVAAMLAATTIARADIAPGPVRSPDEIRRDRKIDDCKERQPGNSCIDMQGKKGQCGWFTWWWIPGSNLRGTEGGKPEFAGYVTRCETLSRKVKDSSGKPTKTSAYKCLICQ